MGSNEEGRRIEKKYNKKIMTIKMKKGGNKSNIK